MKQYADLAEFFDKLRPQTGFENLPRNVPEAKLANDSAYKHLVQAQLDGLLHSCPREIVRSDLFRDFFQLSAEYQVLRGMEGASSDPALRQQADPALASRQGAYRHPGTWPQDIPITAISRGSESTVAPLAWGQQQQRAPAAPLAWGALDAPPASNFLLAAPKKSTASWSPEGVGQSRAPPAASGSPGLFLMTPAPAIAASSPSGAGALGATPLSPTVAPSPAIAAATVVSPGAAPATGLSPSMGSSPGSSMSSPDKHHSGINSSGGPGGRPWCVVCMAKPEEVAVDPCGHLSMCRDCATQVKMCPVCRGPIGKLLRVYVVK